MATIVGKTAGKITAAVVKAQAWTSPITQGPLNKAWRALIIVNRITSPMPKDTANTLGTSSDMYNQHIATTTSNSLAQRNDPWKSRQIIDLQRTGKNPTDMRNWSEDFLRGKTATKCKIKNDIIIVNRNVSPAISLTLQNRPYNLDVNPETVWTSVKSMGRNNSFQMYTGGDDTIVLEISWYSIDEQFDDDVINKCRLLESWSKANGYDASPPTLEIIWGHSGMFDNDKFILASAPYKLENFQNAVGGIYNKDEDFGQRDLKLLPTCAYQTLTFKRVTSINRTHEDIIPSSKLQRTKGVTYDNAQQNL